MTLPWTRNTPGIGMFYRFTISGNSENISLEINFTSHLNFVHFA